MPVVGPMHLLRALSEMVAAEAESLAVPVQPHLTMSFGLTFEPIPGVYRWPGWQLDHLLDNHDSLLVLLYTKRIIDEKNKKNISTAQCWGVKLNNNFARYLNKRNHSNKIENLHFVVCFTAK